MANKIEKIKKVSLRELWEKEDKDFTKWLEENIDYLNDVLDIDISILSREEKVGPFKVDLYGEDNSGNKVIIENQLERTDHTHLGQIITYLTNLEANTAIWIASDPTEEHTKAIDWLNETTPDDISFYLIKLEAIRIGESSSAAPLFTIIKRPTQEKKQLGAEKKEYAQRHILRKEFWELLLDKARQKTDLHSNISPNIYSWVGTGAGKSGMSYNYVILNEHGACELYLDRGKEYPTINKERFDRLFKHKDEIEQMFGGKLKWERLDGKRASRIGTRFEESGLKNRERWNELQNDMIDAMIRLEKSLKPFIINLK